ncbi:hypothetical protein X975_07386, partial [Stegodyphus mimosarum]
MQLLLLWFFPLFLQYILQFGNIAEIVEISSFNRVFIVDNHFCIVSTFQYHLLFKNTYIVM